MIDNPSFINHLQNLSHDRFALSRLPAPDYTAFYYALLADFGCTPAPDTWYLIGTDGCHLCDDVSTLIHKNFPHQPLTLLDLADGADVLIDTLGRCIPVLCTPHRLLCYPFGILDIVQLLNKNC